MPQILYKPLQPGDTITKECVHFCDAQIPEKPANDYYIGKKYSEHTFAQFFLPVEVTAPSADPIAAIKAAPEEKRNWTLCGNPHCPCWVTHYVGSHPECASGIKPGQDDVKEITPAPEKAEEWVQMPAADLIKVLQSLLTGKRITISLQNE